MQRSYLQASLGCPRHGTQSFCRTGALKVGKKSAGRRVLEKNLEPRSASSYPKIRDFGDSKTIIDLLFVDPQAFQEVDFFRATFVGCTARG
jgi:hypothetical protein